MKTRTSGQGRPRGIPNKVTSDVRAMILGALDQLGGQTYLVEQARANPAAFLTLVGRILPKEIKADVTTASIGPDQLRELLASIPVEELSDEALAFIASKGTKSEKVRK